jgi:competence protein ComEA
MPGTYREMGEATRKTVIAGILGVIALSAGVGVGSLRRAPPPTPVDPGVVATSVEMIDVHVAGSVIAPGVVSVPRGSIVADAIEIAGGLRPGAAVESINLAAEVVAGQQIVVPAAGNGAAMTDSAADGIMSLNSAPASELVELPGVGPVLAERIVSFREDNGPFETVEDLLEVPGIGEAKLSSIRDLVRP